MHTFCSWLVRWWFAASFFLWAALMFTHHFFLCPTYTRSRRIYLYWMHLYLLNSVENIARKIKYNINSIHMNNSWKASWADTQLRARAWEENENDADANRIIHAHRPMNNEQKFFFSVRVIIMMEFYNVWARKMVFVILNLICVQQSAWAHNSKWLAIYFKKST